MPYKVQSAHLLESKKAHLTSEFVAVTKNGGFVWALCLRMWSMSKAVSEMNFKF